MLPKMCSIPLDMTVLLGLHQFSLQATLVLARVIHLFYTYRILQLHSEYLNKLFLGDIHTKRCCGHDGVDGMYYFLDRILFHHDFYHDSCAYYWDFLAILSF